MKVALCCAAGMSTSIFMKKMKKYAEEKAIDLEIAAYGVGEVSEVWKQYDVIVMGPQIMNMKKKLEESIPLPVLAIAPMDYGTYNVEKVFREIDAALNTEEK